jgi:O-antigen/teichoic acid export membrane protein
MMGPGKIVDQLLAIGTVRRQALLSIGANIGITAVGYLSTIYVAHTAGAETLGAYFLFLAYYGLAVLCVDGGMGGAAVKKISEGREEDAFFSAQIAARAVFLVAGVVVLLLLTPYMMDLNREGLFPWLVIALTCGTLGGIISAGVYGGGSVGALQVSDFSNTLTRVIVQVLAIYAGFAAAGLAGGFVAGILVSAIINLHFLRFRLVRFNWRHLAAMVPYAWWGFLSGATGVVAGYADTVLVGFFLTSEDVGFYRAPLQLAVLAIFVATSLSTALFPRISGWSEEGNLTAAAGALSRAFTYSLLLAIPFVAGGLLLGERLLYFVYGSAFTVAAPSFYLLLLVQVATLFFTLDGMALSALNRPRILFWTGAVSSLLLVAIEIVLIPRFGIEGAAAALLLAYIVRAGLTRAMRSRFLTIPVEWNAIRNIVVSTAGMSIFVLFFSRVVPLDHVLLVAGLVLAGALFYLFVLLRIDTGIRDEVKEISLRLGIPWPGWM